MLRKTLCIYKSYYYYSLIVSIGSQHALISLMETEIRDTYICSYQIQWNDPVTSQIESPRPQAPIINLSSKVTLCTCTYILRIPAADSVREEAHKTAIKYWLISLE